MTGSLDQTPKSEVTVTLSNGATLTFGTDYTPGPGYLGDLHAIRYQQR
ncbi:hypothetical protein [Enterovibrio norvegicus]